MPYKARRAGGRRGVGARLGAANAAAAPSSAPLRRFGAPIAASAPAHTTQRAWQRAGAPLRPGPGQERWGWSALPPACSNCGDTSIGTVSRGCGPADQPGARPVRQPGPRGTPEPRLRYMGVVDAIPNAPHSAEVRGRRPSAQSGRGRRGWRFKAAAKNKTLRGCRSLRRPPGRAISPPAPCAAGGGRRTERAMMQHVRWAQAPAGKISTWLQAKPNICRAGLQPIVEPMMIGCHTAKISSPDAALPTCGEQSKAARATTLPQCMQRARCQVQSCNNEAAAFSSACDTMVHVQLSQRWVKDGSNSQNSLCVQTRGLWAVPVIQLLPG